MIARRVFQSTKTFWTGVTETTGLPKKMFRPTSDLENWPRLVQLAWVVTDQKGEVIKGSSSVIKPDGFEIPEKATKIHRISQSYAFKYGFEVSKVLEEFEEDLKLVKTIVGHHILYDVNILGAEYIRFKGKDIMEGKDSIDTMIQLREFTNIESRHFRCKNPRLEELYAKLFNCELENNHDAGYDTLATMRCFHEAKRRGYLNG